MEHPRPFAIGDHVKTRVPEAERRYTRTGVVTKITYVFGAQKLFLKLDPHPEVQGDLMEGLAKHFAFDLLPQLGRLA